MSDVETVQMIENALAGARAFREMTAKHLRVVEGDVPVGMNLYGSLNGLAVSFVLDHAKKQNDAAMQLVGDLEVLLLRAKAAA